MVTAAAVDDLQTEPPWIESAVGHLVGFGAGDHVRPVGVVEEHVVLDLVVVLEAKVAVRAMVDDGIVRHVSVVARQHSTVRRRRSSAVNRELRISWPLHHRLLHERIVHEW
jgi:hypothetical protein